MCGPRELGLWSFAILLVVEVGCAVAEFWLPPIDLFDISLLPVIASIFLFAMQNFCYYGALGRLRSTLQITVIGFNLACAIGQDVLRNSLDEEYMYIVRCLAIIPVVVCTISIIAACSFMEYEDEPKYSLIRPTWDI